jgi:hypothetical protein
MSVHVSPPPAVDLLAQAIDIVRPYLDRNLPIRQRASDFWAACVAARDLGAADVVEQEFLNLAKQTGLIRDLGPAGKDDVAHLIRSAFLDWNPFC